MLDLVHETENSQIHLSFHEESGSKLISIDLLWVDESHRRRGLGTKLLLAAIHLADMLNLPIELQARGDIDQNALVRFYASHGFIVTNDAPLLMLMRREPVSFGDQASAKLS